MTCRLTRPQLLALVAGLSVFVFPLLALGESGPPPPGVTPGMKVPIFTQLLYLCGAVATVMVAIIAFLILGKCRFRAANLGDSPTPAAVQALRWSVATTFLSGLTIAAGYFYLTYYALVILVPTIKLPRFAYMLSAVTILTALAGVFMMFVALRARRALPPKA